MQGFRKATGLSQAAVAKKLGITQQSYAEFELNPQLASAERLIKILRLLNVEISLSHSANPQLGDKANSKITKPIKQEKKPSKQRPELANTYLNYLPTKEEVHDKFFAPVVDHLIKKLK